jgi:hypothetical protein
MSPASRSSGSNCRPGFLCAYCGRTEPQVVHGPGLLFRTDWPSCCGRVMVYLPAADPNPSACKETVRELPTPR